MCARLPTRAQVTCDLCAQTYQFSQDEVHQYIDAQAAAVEASA